jgi:membrane-associated protease RseP (regulator of RpoE activity)
MPLAQLSWAIAQQSGNESAESDADNSTDEKDAAQDTADTDANKTADTDSDNEAATSDAAASEDTANDEANSDNADANSADSGVEINEDAAEQLTLPPPSPEAQQDANATSDAAGTSDVDTTSDANAASDVNVNAESQELPADRGDAQQGTSGVQADASVQSDAQEAGPALPPPSSPNDAQSSQPREQSRMVEGQQLPEPNPPAQRSPAADSQFGRANLDARTGRDRHQDLRGGIQFGTAPGRGLMIDHIEQNSFYHTSGFRRGDVIVSIHNQPVRSDADFMRLLVLEPGRRVPVVVLRGGRHETIFVEYPNDVARDNRAFSNQPYQANRQYQANRSYQSNGAYLGVNFDPQARDAAVVLSVNPGSPAQEAGLQAGDIVLMINGQEVRTYPDAIGMVRTMRPGDELEIVFERARIEREAVAMLGSQPGVRTATGADAQYERRIQIVTPQQRQQQRDRVEDDDRDENSRFFNRYRGDGRGGL